MRTVGARFGDRNQVFSYFVPDGDEPRIGDFIFTSVSLSEVGDEENLSVIETRDIVGNGKLARIVKIDEVPCPKATKFYLQLLSVRDIRAAQERNREYLAREGRRREARKQLERMLTEQTARERYGQLAASNPAAAALLAQLEE